MRNVGIIQGQKMGFIIAVMMTLVASTSGTGDDEVPPPGRLLTRVPPGAVPLGGERLRRMLANSVVSEGSGELATPEIFRADGRYEKPITEPVVITITGRWEVNANGYCLSTQHPRRRHCYRLYSYKRSFIRMPYDGVTSYEPRIVNIKKF